MRIFRTLIIFGICLPLAVLLGYVVATPLNRTGLGVFGLVFLLFSIPFLLRWHYPWMVASWNMSALIFLIPGKPLFWMLMVGISFLFSLLHYAMEKNKVYVSVPSLIVPLVFLAAVVLLTAELRGGVGLQVLGSTTAGGKKYVYIFAATVGYFALTSYRIPPSKAHLYVSLFFLGGITSAIGNLLPLVNPAFYIIFAIFPPEQSGLEAIGLAAESSITRFGGLSVACAAIYCALLARYGIRGIFDFSSPLRFLPFQFKEGVQVNKPWRFIFFLLALIVSLLGGFRSILILFLLTFVVQFFYEKLFSTRLFPVLILCVLLGGVIVLPMARNLPLSAQRALSFLPINVDPLAQINARSSSEWRWAMWKRVIPEIPQYLLLGKGLGLNFGEIELLANQVRLGQTDNMEVALVAGDYHNGPLSLIVPFGIFGVIGFLWFLVASVRVLANNYRYGDPALRNINRFFLAYYVARIIFFFTVFGSFYSDFGPFLSIVGLNVALNGGMQTRDSSLRRTERFSEPIPARKLTSKTFA